MIFKSAYCVLRTENIFVCCCGVGSDRAAGVGVSLGTLDLVRVDATRGTCAGTSSTGLPQRAKLPVTSDRLRTDLPLCSDTVVVFHPIQWHARLQGMQK